MSTALVNTLMHCPAVNQKYVRSHPMLVTSVFRDLTEEIFFKT